MEERVAWADLCARETFPHDGDCRLVRLNYAVRSLLVPGPVILTDDLVAQPLIQGLRPRHVHVDAKLDLSIATIDGASFQRFDEDRADPT